AKQLQIDKKEGFIPQQAFLPTLSKSRVGQRPAKTAAKNMLDKLPFWRACYGFRIAFGIKPGRLVILKQIAVKLVRARAGDKRYRRAAAAAKLGRKIGGD